jgi:hypothetical protein
LLSNRPRRAQATAAEYARRFGCEEGFRDAKWELGFAQARIPDIHAWARLFALFALALLQDDKSLFGHLSPPMQFNLEAR